MLPLAQMLTLITVFALPLFPMQSSSNVSYVLFVLALLLLPLFVRVFWEAWENWTTRFFVLFLLASEASTIFSIDQSKSLMQFGVFLSCFVVFVTSGRIFSDQKSRERLALVLIVITTVMSVISLYHTLILHYVSKFGRGVSFAWVYFGHNHLSALLIFAIPLSFYFLKVNWPNRFLRIFLLFALFFLLFSLILSLAVASIISILLAGYVYILLFQWVSNKKRQMLFLIWLLLISIVLFSLGVRTGIINPRLLENELNIPARLSYAKTAVQNGIEHPFSGTGLGTFQSFFYGNRTIHTHNFFFQMLSDAGFPGFWTSQLLVLSILLGGLGRMRGIVDQRERWFFAAVWVGLFASTLNALVDFDWQLPTVFFLFWLLAGLF